jgi:acyl-CoA reductase-like NAD-dependent aldehyde dehydrogenase
MSDLTTHRLYIDGVWTDSDGSEQVEVVNPATEQVIGLVPQATRTDVVRAIEAARRAFDEGPWPARARGSAPRCWGGWSRSCGAGSPRSSS